METHSQAWGRQSMFRQARLLPSRIHTFVPLPWNEASVGKERTKAVIGCPTRGVPGRREQVGNPIALCAAWRLNLMAEKMLADAVA